MATVMAILCKERGGIKIHKQLLYCPVTDARFDTPSYIEFATGYYLQREGMMWFWDQYTTSETDRAQITASPLRASTEQLRGLPDAMILNGQADVLRDEGEAYAVKLRESGYASRISLMLMTKLSGYLSFSMRRGLILGFILWYNRVHK